MHLRNVLITAMLVGSSIIIGCASADAAADANDDSASADQNLTSLKVRSLAAGASHTCALLDGGAVRCWGWNGFGQLGIGSSNPYPSNTPNGIPAVDFGGRRATAIAAEANRSCALLDDNNSVACWGHRGYGAADLAPVIVRLDETRKAHSLTIGNAFQCVLFEDHTVKCWGDNDFGQLGRESPASHADDPHGLSPMNFGSGHTVRDVQAGGWHACALLDDGSVKCWGGNEAGQLGIGSRSSRGGGFFQMGDHLRSVDLGSGRTALAIATGTDHTCALLDDRSVKCWGLNAYGELGLGVATTAIGEGPDQMGDRLATVKLPPGLAASSIIAGGRVTCVSLLPAGASLGPDHDDRVRRFACWGMNDHGQLGTGDRKSHGTASEDMGEGLKVLDLGRGITPSALTTGGFHTCALADNGTVKCWGFNLYGDLGVGTQGPGTDLGDDANEMGDALPVIVVK